MADRTPFAGLTRLAPGESIASDGYGLQDRNPTLLDYFASLILNHRHDGHAALAQADPPVDPTVGTAASGGSIPADTTITVGYTLLDQDNGETLLNANPQSVTTDPGLLAPDVAPVLAAEIVAGTLLAGDYSYAVTVTDGLGGETTLSPQADVTIPPGSPTNQIRVTNLSGVSGAVGGAGWRLWRAVNGGEWHLMATGDGITDEFLDDGSTAADCGVTPPVATTTSGANMLTVTVPSPQPAGATGFRIYASLDGTFTGDCLLGTYDIAQLDQAQDFTTLAFEHGAPPNPATAMPGAERIQGGGGATLPGYPSDFALDFHQPYFYPDSSGGFTPWDPVNSVGHHIGFDGYPDAGSNDVMIVNDLYGRNGRSYGDAHYYLDDSRDRPGPKPMGEGSVTLRFQLTADPAQSLYILVGGATIPGGRRLYAQYTPENLYSTLGIVVWDPLGGGQIDSLTDATGNQTAVDEVNNVATGVDRWLRFSVTGVTAKAELFDTDPAVGAPNPILSFSAAAGNAAELAQVLYGGPPAFGWSNTGVPPDTLRLFGIVTHSDTPGYVEPPPPAIARPNGMDLPLGMWTGGLSWSDPSYKLSALVRPIIEPFGVLMPVMTEDFNDANLLNSAEFHADLGSISMDIDEVNGYLVNTGDLNQSVSFQWYPDDVVEILGDFIWVMKLNRPNIGSDGKSTGLNIMKAIGVSGGGDIWGWDYPNGTYNIPDMPNPTVSAGLNMRAQNAYPVPAVSHYQVDMAQPVVGDSWLVLRRTAGTWRFERWLVDPLGGVGAADAFVESPAADGWQPGPVKLSFAGSGWREQYTGTFQNPARTLVRLDSLALQRQQRRVALVMSANAEAADGSGGMAPTEVRVVVGGV